MAEPTPQQGLVVDHLRETATAFMERDEKFIGKDEFLAAERDQGTTDGYGEVTVLRVLTADKAVPPWPAVGRAGRRCSPSRSS